MLKGPNHLTTYRKFSSKEALDLLKGIYREEYGNSKDFTQFLKDPSLNNIKFKNVKDLKFFSNYQDKVVILGLHREDCNACLGNLKMLIKLEKKFLSKKECVFINLFYENKQKLVINSIIVDKDLFKKMARQFDITGVPHILIIDKGGDIRYQLQGFKEGKNYLPDLEYKINLLLKEKK